MLPVIYSSRQLYTEELKLKSKLTRPEPLCLHQNCNIRKIADFHVNRIKTSLIVSEKIKSNFKYFFIVARETKIEREAASFLLEIWISKNSKL